MSPLTLPFLAILTWPLSIADLAIIAAVSTRCRAEPRRLEFERAITLTSERQHQRTQSDTEKELEKGRDSRNSKQVVGGQRSPTIGKTAPLLAAEAELCKGPGSRYGDLFYRGP